MRSRDPFGAAVEKLRGQIRRGEIAPGEPLIVLDLARALTFSATPVREALAYLAGEGLIDGRREKLRGYATWTLTAVDLADLYRLHATLVLLALGEAARRGARLDLGRALVGGDDLATAAGYARATELVFDRIVRGAGSAVIRRAHRVVADRLHLVRLLEPGVLIEAAQELRNLAAFNDAGALLAQAIRTYHRRRAADGERLLAAAQRRASAGPSAP